MGEGGAEETGKVRERVAFRLNFSDGIGNYRRRVTVAGHNSGARDTTRRFRAGGNKRNFRRYEPS